MTGCLCCAAGAVPEAPVPLCAEHLGAVHDWVAEAERAPDSAPAPCRLCGSQLGLRTASGWICGVCEWPAGSVPDAELPPPRVDVVYYIRSEERIKIGTSANPRRRLRVLWHDALLAFERGDRVAEQRRHRQFASARIGSTEWFNTCDELEHHIDTLRCGVDDPWRLYARWMAEAAAAR